MIEAPRALLQDEQAHDVALTLQRAAVPNQRQQVISDRERPVVTGVHESQIHARLYHASELSSLPPRRYGVVRWNATPPVMSPRRLVRLDCNAQSAAIL